MEVSIQNKLVAFDGIVVFGADHPLTPVIARVVALLAQMAAIANALRTNGANQVGGNSEFRSGISTRRLAADELLVQMRAINKIARGLPRAEFPGVRELFRMPRKRGYATVIATAQSFLDAVGNVKATFVERSLPADFDEQLAEALAAVGAASTTRASGKAGQVGGTAGLTAKAREGMEVLRELDSIYSHLYRNDPVLLAAWQSTCHVEKDPVREGTSQPPPGNGSGSGSGSGTPPPLATNEGAGAGGSEGTVS